MLFICQKLEIFVGLLVVVVVVVLVVLLQGRLFEELLLVLHDIGQGFKKLPNLVSHLSFPWNLIQQIFR